MIIHIRGKNRLSGFRMIVTQCRCQRFHHVPWAGTYQTLKNLSVKIDQPDHSKMPFFIIFFRQVERLGGLMKERKEIFYHNFIHNFR